MNHRKHSNGDHLRIALSALALVAAAASTAALAGARQEAGATWDDVVEITSFHTDLTTQMPAIVAVKKNYVKPPFPAWTAIQVSRLIPPNGITEIKIVAK